MLETCGETGPDGVPDQVIAGVDLDDPTGAYPLDAGFVVRTGSESSYTDVLIAQHGQVLIVTAYSPAPDSEPDGLDTTALSEAVLIPTKETIGNSY